MLCYSEVTNSSDDYPVHSPCPLFEELHSIGMPCTHRSDISHVIPSTRESMTQALYCRNDKLSIVVDHFIYPEQARQAATLAAATLDCECGDFCNVLSITCQTPPPLNAKHNTNVFVNAPQCDISLLISTHRNCFYGDCAVSRSYGATI